MNTLTRLVFDFTIVRRAVIFNFGWAIHVSPIDHIDKVRDQGLIPNTEAACAEAERSLPASVGRHGLSAPCLQYDRKPLGNRDGHVRDTQGSYPFECSA